MNWCARCGRRLTNVTIEGKGSCPAHGMVWGEPYAPTLVAVDDEVIGIYLHKDMAGAIIYRRDDGGIEHAPDNARMVRYDDYEGEW